MKGRRDRNTAPTSSVAAPFTVRCHPLPVNLGTAYPGQMLAASLVVWRSDGAPIEHFLISLPTENAPPGFATYTQRQDARHFRVDVVWVAPEVADRKAKVVATAFEVAADGAALRVPIRARMMPAARGQTALTSRRARVPPHFAGLAAAGIFTVLAGVWAFWQENRPLSPVLSRAPQQRAALPPPLAAPARLRPAPGPRIQSVRSWKGVAVWRVSEDEGAPGRMLVDLEGRKVRRGQPFRFATKKAVLPASLLITGVRFAPEDVRSLSLQNGLAYRVRRVLLPHASPAEQAALRTRRDNLQSIAAFLRKEASRAAETPGGLLRYEVHTQFLREFATGQILTHDFRDWNVRLTRPLHQSGGINARLTQSDLAQMAQDAARQADANRPAPPSERYEKEFYPLEGALVLTRENGEPLRPLDASDSGQFYVGRFSQPIRLGDRQFSFLVSPVPFEKASSGSLPLYVLDPKGITTLKPGELPAEPTPGYPLLLREQAVQVTVVDGDTRPKPAS